MISITITLATGVVNAVSVVAMARVDNLSSRSAAQAQVVCRYCKPLGGRPFCPEAALRCRQLK